MPKDRWYADGLKFTCTQCGNCCSGDPGYVWATKAEIAAIAKFLGRGDGWLDERHLRRVGFRYSLTEKPDGDCVFLERRPDGSTGCRIYPVRPVQCRTWPFWPELLHSRDAWERAKRKCPGMDQGRHYDFVQIETIRRMR
ncbi:MAG: YkgJ family cysteine cluster protein [Phycisphaerales bacterium]|nr:MAG: YkgJ family cysteine cluster protein [Phycisphaerales bacterium]